MFFADTGATPPAAVLTYQTGPALSTLAAGLERCFDRGMFCPRCGSTNDDAAAACTLCGVSLVEAAEKIAQGPTSRRNEAPPPSRVGTMLGVAVPASGAVAPPDVPAPSAKAGTMIGFAAAPGSAPVPSRPISVPPPSMGAPAVGGFPMSSAKPGTMLGYAVPAGGSTQPPSVLAASTQDPPLRTPRQVLAQLAKQHGNALLSDPERCAAEIGAEHRYATWLIVAALESSIPHRLMARATPPDEAAIVELTRDLAIARGMHESAARHAVESWAIALGMMTPRT